MVSRKFVTMNWQNLLGRIPYKIIFIWLIIIVFGYYFTIPILPSSSDKPDYYTYSSHLQTAFMTTRIKEYLPQAIVFISMGDVSKESLVEDSITSVRSIGHWTEKIYILTDRPRCFESLAISKSNTILVEVPSKNSIIEIKRLKTELFNYLPPEIERVLYMDIDILVTRNIGPFLQDISHLLYLHHSSQKNTISSNLSSLSPHNFDFAAFLDAKGHYVGFCSGCEKWHTGVIYFTRHLSEKCMKSWGDILSSKMFQTDQESLDFAEKNGSCIHPVAIPSKHLLFAKDYIAMVLTSGQTFVHLTSANRAKEADYFYRELVLPRIRNSLHPPLKPYVANSLKPC